MRTRELFWTIATIVSVAACSAGDDATCSQCSAPLVGAAGAGGAPQVESGAPPDADAASEASADGGWPASCNGVVSGETAKALVAAGALLLDVRLATEYASGHIAGAINIPVGDLSARLVEIDAGRPIVVYCASGARAARARDILCAAGYSVYDLGPMASWPG